jgi:phosphinothricin acetyltransferase
MQPMHWPEVKKIYEEGIKTGHATFQLEAPAWESWDKSHLELPRLVAISNNLVVGWAALSRVSERCVYAGVAEVSIYIASAFRGTGLGKQLLKELVFESEKNNFWTLQAGIFPENLPSIAIHEQNGFRKVGVREKIGKLNGVWRDTLLFERRSRLIGID